MYAVFGCFMIDFGMFCRACGCFHVFFKCLQGLFAVKMRCGNGENMVQKWWKYGAKMAKWWCICCVYMLGFLHFCCQGSEMVVRLQLLVVWFRLKFIVLRLLRCAFLAFPILISQISQSIPPFSPTFYSKSTPYINISHLSKPPNPYSNRRKQC